jgi:hypothetical protein
LLSASVRAKQRVAPDGAVSPEKALGPQFGDYREDGRAVRLSHTARVSGR